MKCVPLITRLHGHRVICQRVHLDFGPIIWQGEFRTDADKPYVSRVDAYGRYIEGRVAPDLGELLRVLSRLAEQGPTRIDLHESLMRRARIKRDAESAM